MALAATSARKQRKTNDAIIFLPFSGRATKQKQIGTFGFRLHGYIRLEEKDPRHWKLVEVPQ